MRGTMATVDYRMRKRALLRQLRRGLVSRGDVCDAHPDLVRAAKHIGEPTRDDCPVCGTPGLRLVAYPYGKASPEVERLTNEVGYVTASGIEQGMNGNAVSLHNLRRVEVEGTWSLWTFALSVWSGYRPQLRRSR